jgi:ABC-2 type transport system permease protein
MPTRHAAVSLPRSRSALLPAGALAEHDGSGEQDQRGSQQAGFIFFFPLGFISNAFVPTQGMPPVLRAIANWNPMSAIAAACRNLFGGINPSATVRAWPMQHPEIAVLAWSAGLIAIFAPLAVILYKRKVLR